MKKIYISYLLFLLTSCISAQIPQWVINVPKPSNPTISYVLGVGEGSSYKEARNEAFNDILRKLIVQYRLTVNSNDIMSSVYDGVSLSTISKDYNLPPMKETCSYQTQQYGRNRVYLLYQTAANGMISNPEFENFTKCNAGRKKWNCYIAWNIAGTGYPWNLFSGIEFRYGKTLGVGGYADLGMDFTAVTASYKYGLNDYPKVAYLTKVFFRYAVGVKFFAFKGLFIDFGYGTIAKPSAKVDGGVMESDYCDFWDGQLNQLGKQKILDMVQYSSSGLLFHIGYNLVTNLDKGCGFFLGISAGASYDVFLNEVAPQINLKVGIAWNIKKH